MTSMPPPLSTNPAPNELAMAAGGHETICNAVRVIRRLETMLYKVVGLIHRVEQEQIACMEAQRDAGKISRQHCGQQIGAIKCEVQMVIQHIDATINENLRKLVHGLDFPSETRPQARSGRATQIISCRRREKSENIEII